MEAGASHQQFRSQDSTTRDEPIESPWVSRERFVCWVVDWNHEVGSDRAVRLQRFVAPSRRMPHLTRRTPRRDISDAAP
jgi:hypothetical protein